VSATTKLMNHDCSTGRVVRSSCMQPKELQYAQYNLVKAACNVVDDGGQNHKKRGSRYYFTRGKSRPQLIVWPFANWIATASILFPSVFQLLTVDKLNDPTR